MAAKDAPTYKAAAARNRKAVPLGGSDVCDRAEILMLLSKAARRGNVPAMRLLLDELRADGIEDEVAPSVIDELAQRRSATG